MNQTLKKIGFALLCVFAAIGAFASFMWLTGQTSVDLAAIAVIVQDENNDLVFENPQLVGKLRLIYDEESGKAILVNSPLVEEAPLVEAGSE